MAILQFALIILAIGIIVALSVKFLWLASLILIFKTLTTFLPFGLFADKFGIDSMLTHFIIILSITIFIHFAILSVTANFVLFRYIFYILLLGWVILTFDLKEVEMLKGWVEETDFEFTGQWFKDQFKSLFSMSAEDYKKAFSDFFGGIFEGVKKIFGALFGKN